MSAQTSPPPAHDGSSGNVLQRAEPKVKASALAAFLTPLALYYVYRYVPGVAAMPHELDAIVATGITGGAAFAAGFPARAVDRVDLVFGAQLAKADASVTRAGDKTIGAQATDDIEAWTREVAGKVAGPVKAAVVDAVHAVESAATAGQDPLVAARAEVPQVLDSLDRAVAAGRAEATAAVAPVVAQAVTDAPALVAEVTAAPTAPKTADDLMAELKKMIALLDQGTPIADAVQASARPTPPVPGRPVPVDVAPATAPMAAVAAGTPAPAPTSA